MATEWWSDDDQLLAALDDALRSVHEVPASVVEAGRISFAWRDVDAQIAALIYDSAGSTGTRDRVAAVTRSKKAALRTLTFATERFTVHVEVLRDALHGQVVPPTPGEVEVCPADGESRTVHVDEVGWFVVRPLPTGPFRLRCCPLGGSPVLTDWITL